MFWIFVTIVSYILFASSSLVDRYLLTGPLRSPLAYAFYVNITSVFAFALVPFGFFVPDASFIALSFVYAIFVVSALYMFFHTIANGSISRTIPMIGALTPIMTLVLSMFLIDIYSIGGLGILSFALLILATVFLSLNVVRGRLIPSWTDIIHVVITAFLFGLSFVLIKIIYDNITFINGFIWTRLFVFLIALSFLFIPSVRDTVFRKNPLKKKAFFFPALLGKSAGVTASLLQNYAVSIVAVSQLAFINALSGVQYITLLILIILLGRYRPSILKEQLNRSDLLLRACGVFTLVAGLYLLFLTIME